MRLKGSCHCGKVRFSVESAQPVPFMRCYCSICRKTAGAGGYAINLGADTHSMKVTGLRFLRIYRARVAAEGHAGGTRRFDLFEVEPFEREVEVEVGEPGAVEPR